MNYVITVEKTFRMEFDIFAKNESSARAKALELIEDEFCSSVADEIDSQFKIKCSDIDW